MRHGQEGRTAAAVVQESVRDGGEREATVGVHQGVALVPRHLLSGTVAVGTFHTDAAREGGLCIQYGHRWLGVAVHPLTVGRRQRMGQPSEGARARDAQKPAMDGLGRREVAGRGAQAQPARST